MSTTKIEWATDVWNPVTGCTEVSAGCKNCYAKRMHKRLQKMAPDKYSAPFHTIQTHEDVLLQPLKWRKHKRVFVNSMSDLFHENVSFEFIDMVMAIITLSRRHTFMVLTKRPLRMRYYFSAPKGKLVERWANATYTIGLSDKYDDNDAPNCAVHNICESDWPISNLWLGVSVEDQSTADTRIPELIRIPAAIHFLSCEPLLGPIDFENIPGPMIQTKDTDGLIGAPKKLGYIDWVIAGGESGKHARPMHPVWVRGLRDQCHAANVPFFFKQWGEWIEPVDTQVTGKESADSFNLLYPGKWYSFPDGLTTRKSGKARAGRKLDGAEHNALPEKYWRERMDATYKGWDKGKMKLPKDSMDNVVKGVAQP
jgi:protein gp37